MKNRHLRYLTGLLVLLTLLFSGKVASAHFDSAYWHEGEVSYDASNWMNSLDDSKRLSQLSIPGTHDSMAYTPTVLQNIVKTQTLSLENQLQAGIRYFDIRVKYNGNSFAIHHGLIYLGFSLDDVLDQFQTFLANHPRETLIVRINQEQSSASDDQMEDLFQLYLNKYPDLFWDSSNQLQYNPLLKDVRGKVVLLSSVMSITKGLSYRNVLSQDNYHLNTNWDLYQKWMAVKNHLIAANSGNENMIYLNHLSGSGGSFPYFVAGGRSSSGTYADRLLTGLTEPAFKNRYPEFPRVGKWRRFSSIAFEGTNAMTANFLEANPDYRRVGIVVADFPGERLIQNIIDVNFR